MLFNSPEFLFGFLPLVLGVYYLLGRSSHGGALNWLVAASLLFYGWWNPHYLILIGGSIVFNYVTGKYILRCAGTPRKALLTAGISANLACIGYFKYAGFIDNNVSAIFGISFAQADIVLPLAISFFTFQQIAFLVDTYQGKVQEAHFSRYSLFVLFFPQLIAGPIVHHQEMMPQFASGSTRGQFGQNLNRGITIFALGLFKKIVLADTLALIADPAFAMADAGQAMTPVDAWTGALAYSFQLYFDFSGYSDMALGLAIMFGIRLPLNFYSPYKSRNIIEFWRRWHMTLSRFLRDYLYIPLGGNRRGKTRRYVNLMLTMLIGGLWHGAGWTFVIWGGLHGLFMTINHGWRAALTRMNLPAIEHINRLIAPVITFFCVVLAWVYFRAASLDGANFMLGTMFGINETTATTSVFSGELLGNINNLPLSVLFQPLVENANTAAIFTTLSLSAFVAFCMPNAVEFMGSCHPALRATVPTNADTVAGRLRWRASPGWALMTATLLLACLASGTQLSPFLYFQF